MLLLTSEFKLDAFEDAKQEKRKKKSSLRYEIH